MNRILTGLRDFFRTLFGVTFFAAIVAALYHAHTSRGFLNLLGRAEFWVTVLCPVAIIFLVFAWSLSQTTKELPPLHARLAMALMFLLAMTFHATLIAAVFFSVLIVIKDLAPTYWEVLDITWFWKLLAALLAFSLGAALFFFRLHYRCVYGLTEVIVGVLIAGNYIFDRPVSLGDSGSTILLGLLTASVYLVVRGLDNYHQGVVKDEDGVIRWLKVYWDRRENEKAPPGP